MNELYQQIEKALSRFVQLTPSEAEQFCSKLQFKKLRPKELLLAEGQICKHAYFITKGCMRYFYNKDGADVTGQFFFENAWYTDYVSYLSGNPTTQNIQALEHTEILMISRSDLEALFTSIPKFERFGRLMAENAFLGLHQRTEMLINLSPEERYIQLINARPKVMERIPQHYIASYLGIQAPSLSRIRKRIAQN